MRAVRSGVVAAGLVAGFLLLLGVGLSSIRDAPTTTPDGRVELLQAYDSAFVSSWVRGCVASGESVAFCRCAIDEYTSRLRPDEFETAAAVAHSGGQLSELPESLREAVTTVERDCR